MEERSPRLRPVLLLVLLALLAGIVGGLAGGLIVRLSYEDEAAPSSASEPGDERQVVLQEDSAVIDVVARAAPSVVTIVNELSPREDRYGMLLGEVSVGSGVIIDEDGFIVTNEHVIRGAGRLTVILHDGEERSASIVSSDEPFTDLAVIKIDSGGLDALSWGDSDALQLGQQLVAIGSALHEFHNSVTVGVVSGLHRQWPRNGVIMEDLVQTDAAINHGNSGGALLNTQGELIGLNTTVVRSTDSGEVVEGIAFAISSNLAAPIVRAIVEEGSYPRAFLGVQHQDIDSITAQLVDLPIDRGALITLVSDGTPAGEAGFEEGDIILRMGDIDLNEEMPFLNALGQIAPGETVDFLVNRGGDEITLEVTLAARQR